MSTNSLIGIRKSDDTFRAIYCHWDGDPNTVGVILKNCYRSKTKVLDLLSLGSISALGPYVSVPKKYAHLGNHTFDTPIDNVTIAYNRDRHEEKISAADYKIVNKHFEVTKGKCFMGPVFLYLFDINLKDWETFEICGQNGDELHKIYPNYEKLTKEAVRCGIMDYSFVTVGK